MSDYPRMIYNSDDGSVHTLMSEDDPRPPGNWSDQPGDSFYQQRPRTDHFETVAPDPNEALANRVADIIIRRLREELISRTIQQELTQQQSFTDPLTEIYNRHSLEDMAGRFMSQARRSKKPLTFMLIDVDQFKQVNTKFGHLTGDVVLANTAALLKHSVRGSDAVFRYGGDEFLIILADTSSVDARYVVERIRTGLVEWNRAGHLENFELSLSMGVAEWAEGKTLTALLDSADHEMYAVKAEQKLSKGKATGV